MSASPLALHAADAKNSKTKTTIILMRNGQIQSGFYEHVLVEPDGTWCITKRYKEPTRIIVNDITDCDRNDQNLAEHGWITGPNIRVTSNAHVTAVRIS
jgi:hypothetical protein